MNDCLFCKIVKKEIPITKIYEDKKVLAILDIQPVNDGHVLIIPKKHAVLITELDDNLTSHLFKVAKKINISLRKSGLKCEGVNYFLADGEAAMQEVPHVHLHVFPRYKKDGFGLKFAKKYFKLPSRKKLDIIAKKIKNNK
ncbi:HIT domain-containing protein [Candidatus Woesearchaeota archaeon]|jgi:histidine triad (HIT) family protein|nr:HIT domain-containing protein [Candidatus Woesearchaeota archaeon]MBT4336495.1 HIT domain-containing protein [Candidatus Woesearchaeota archaeon]MBT4469908.1 HIT domain-containing protein [Candidatus Woesearchaeota archaeon]MBT6744421.1 HIT domain-containing protein [Candidatus Woesearchaeota archaeon]